MAVLEHICQIRKLEIVKVMKIRYLLSIGAHYSALMGR